MKEVFPRRVVDVDVDVDPRQGYCILLTFPEGFY